MAKANCFSFPRLDACCTGASCPFRIGDKSYNSLDDKPLHLERLLRLFKGCQEFVPRDFGLGEDRPQGRAFDRPVLGMVSGVRVPSALTRIMAMWLPSRTVRKPRAPR